LGHSNVQHIVRQHDGEIHVVSEPGQGTTFEIVLPAASESAPPPEPQCPV
jgi:signal transduction histidine kinase